MVKNKIDIEKWKKFNYENFFEIATTNKKLTNKELSDNGNIPVYSSSTSNNGLFGYTENEPEYIISEEIPMYVIFGDHTKSMFIVKNNFCVMDNVKVLIPKIKNDSCIRFITTVWKESIPNIGYARHWAVARESQIPLPAKVNGEPDWEFMEEYMKKTQKKAKDTINLLKVLNRTNTKCNVEGWKTFSLYELFEANNTGNILARDVIDGTGETPYVTASGINNGVVAHIDASKYSLIKGNCILVGGKTFTLTYQSDDFVSNDSHNFEMHIKNYEIGMLEYLFLISVIRSAFSKKYYWGDAVTKDKLLNEKILLPTLNDNPNWEYMRQYMKKILENEKRKLEVLNLV